MNISVKANHNVSDFTVKILIASFLAQIMTVAVHHFGAVSRDFAQIGHPLDDKPVTSWFVEYMYHLSIGFGTVVFFAIAGYLFFHGFNKEGAWKKKVGTRLRTLGIPYIIWNFIASPWFTAILIPVFALFMPWLGTARETSFIEVFMGNAPGFYPSNSPLWFVRELLIVSLLSPVLWRLINNRHGYVFLIVSFALWVVAAKYWWGGVENITQAVFAFSLGGYWACSSRSPFSFSYITTVIVCVIVLLLEAAELYFELSLNIVVGLKCVAGCVIVFGIANYLSNTRFAYWFAWLGEAAFFIYLTHIIGRGEMSKLVISIFKPENDLSSLLTVIFIWIFIIFYTVGAWALLRRFAPKLLYVLLGGRVKKHFSIVKGKTGGESSGDGFVKECKQSE